MSDAWIHFAYALSPKLAVLMKSWYVSSVVKGGEPVEPSGRFLNTWPGFVERFLQFHILTGSAWADSDRKLSELVDEVGTMVEHFMSKSTQLSDQMDHPVNIKFFPSFRGCEYGCWS